MHDAEKKKRLRPGHARVEFLAVKPEVDVLLEKGHTLMGAYDLLREQGKITMSYQAFHKNYTGITERRAKLMMKAEQGKKVSVPSVEVVAPAAPPVVRPAGQAPEGVCDVPQAPPAGPQVIETGNSKTVDPKQYDSTDLT